MLWAKLWTDILGDPKLMRAARKGARHLALTPWLVAFAKQASDGGRLTVGGVPAEPEDISAKIPGCKPRDVSTCCENLTSIDVLTRDEDGAYRFTNWTKRQGGAPSGSASSVAERVRKHRERKRGSNALQDVTRNETEIEIEKELEQEREKEEETPVTSAAASSAPELTGRALLLNVLGPTQRAAMEHTLNVMAQGYDLPNDAPKRVPTLEEMDRACRELASSVPAGNITVRTVGGYIARVMRGEQPKPEAPNRRFDRPKTALELVQAQQRERQGS